MTCQRIARAVPFAVVVLGLIASSAAAQLPPPTAPRLVTSGTATLVVGGMTATPEAFRQPRLTAVSRFRPLAWSATVVAHDQVRRLHCRGMIAALTRDTLHACFPRVRALLPLFE